eukprot:maker-scaffold_12-snap-gene-9.1-mRNA-1 protein AED:0.29 eAED:0.30 QI:0/0/0/1/1/1/2/0/536
MTKLKEKQQTEDCAKDAAHLFHFSNEKAGTKATNKRKAEIQRVIYDSSKDSSYFKNAQRVDKNTQKKIREIKETVNGLGISSLNYLLRDIDLFLEKERAKRPRNKVCCVIDMDMFYAAVEMRENPDLKGKPIAVGGMSMISTTNYVARKYGVRSAMPGFIALKLCPNLIFVDHHPEKYKEVSEEFFNVLEEYDTFLSTISLDEGYLDITSYLINKFQISDEQLSKENYVFSKYEKEIKEVVNEIREKVFKRTQLSCSAGIGPCFMAAKIASDINKPNGQYFVGLSEKKLLEFLNPLSVRKVPGIGKVTEKILNDGLNIQTVEDLYQNRSLVYKFFKEATRNFLLRASLGLSSSIGENSGAERKSISCSRTFYGLETLDDLFEQLKKVCLSLCQDLNKKQLGGKTLTVKLKNVDFRERNKQRKYINTIADDVDQMFERAKLLFIELLEAFKMNREATKLRLIGVALSDLNSIDKGLVKKGKQVSLLSFMKKKENNKTEIFFLCPFCQRGFEPNKKDLFSLHQKQCKKREEPEVIEIL